MTDVWRRSVAVLGLLFIVAAAAWGWPRVAVLGGGLLLLGSIPRPGEGVRLAALAALAALCGAAFVAWRTHAPPAPPGSSLSQRNAAAAHAMWADARRSGAAIAPLCLLWAAGWAVVIRRESRAEARVREILDGYDRKRDEATAGVEWLREEEAAARARLMAQVGALDAAREVGGPILADEVLDAAARVAVLRMGARAVALLRPDGTVEALAGEPDRRAVSMHLPIGPAGEIRIESPRIPPDAMGGFPEFLAAQVVLSLERAARFEETARKASTDGLTGLGNRRALDERLGREVPRAAAMGAHLAVCFLDVDRFKRVNDSYSHATGDRVLVEISRAIQRVIRNTDHAFRYGGEEFAVLCTETDLEGARGLGERLRQAAARLRVRPVEAAGTITPTISVGVAAFDSKESAADFLRRADAALYRAKEGGRNRVEVSA